MPAHRASTSRNLYPWLIGLAMVALAVVVLRLEGRQWWCACGERWLWISSVWTRHCSRHLADPYTLTHVSHGLVFFVLFTWLKPKWPLATGLCASVGIAAAWEMLENSAFIIQRYRTTTMSVEYLGDSVVNALGDIAACAVGFILARRVGVRAAIITFIALELILLYLIRDNLTLGTLMFIHSFNSIKEWQMAAQGG